MIGPADQDALKLGEIMLKRYLRLGESHTLAEVIGFLSDDRFAADGMPYLVVINKEGGFAGMLNAKHIFAALMGGETEASMDETSFFAAASSRLQTPVGEIMDRDIPTLSSEAGLQEAFACFDDSTVDVIALLEDDRVVGLITGRILFETASRLTVHALSGGVIPDEPGPG